MSSMLMNGVCRMHGGVFMSENKENESALTGNNLSVSKKSKELIDELREEYLGEGSDW